ncbi:MAG: GAF domain-containing sensor histidine kinase [Pirellulales bacterium]|nr:GAF domain-containing sensor histidine kinase [Pirellulales bacterium]
MPTIETPKKEQLDDLLVVQAQVLETLCGDISLKEMLHVIAKTIERQSGEMLCSILLLEGNTLRHGAAPSLPDEYSRAIDGATIGPSAGSCGTAAYTKKTMIVSDIATDPLWANYRDLALRHGLRACWSTPILSADDQVIGTFALYYRTARLPNHRERRLMTVWTNVVALGIRRKQAEEALRAEQQFLLHLFRAQEYERKLTAYELHDGIAQYAASAIMHLESYLHALGQEPPPAQLATTNDLLHKTLDESRRMINGLRPPILDEGGLVMAIEHLIGEPCQQGIAITFDHSADFERLPPALEVAIFRITQEALTNATKHSDSPTVQIVLTRQADRVRLTVRDQGCGFSPTCAKENTLGLRGIRERVNLLGGSVVIDSQPGKGSCISVDLPVLQIPSDLSPTAEAPESPTAC